MSDGTWIEIDGGDTTWRVEASFMRSNWTCIWGKGCKGILDEPAEQLQQGCCSVGAEMADVDEAMRLSAYAALLDRQLFEHIDVADSDGIFSDESRSNTRVVDGACIFLNRPGYSGGQGCALHLAALAAEESPIEWKPSVCWQLPIHIDWEPVENGEIATLRRWSRADWGPEGATMAWLCTDESECYVGDSPVIDSLRDELEAIVGTPVYVELKSKLSEGL